MIPWTVAHQAPLWNFPWQEYWNRLLFPSPGDLADPGLESWCPSLQADSSPSESARSPQMTVRTHNPAGEGGFWRDNYNVRESRKHPVVREEAGQNWLKERYSS